jgi:uncharacterized membrane protein YbhN (UPF0104 family)
MSGSPEGRAPPAPSAAERPEPAARAAPGLPPPHAALKPPTEEMPRVHATRRRTLLFAVFVVSALAVLYVVLPQLGGVRHTWDRLNNGDAWWIAIAVLVQLLSMASYIAIFRGVQVPPGSPIGWSESYQITMAGLAATRLFAAAGAGGIALTAWALRRSGMEPRLVACRMIAFTALIYGVFMATLVVCGLGLYLGLFPGQAPFAITVVPAIFGAVVITIFLAVSLLPGDFDRLVARWSDGGRLGRLASHAAAAPAAAASGIRTAIGLVQSRDWSLLGAIGWWAFDIAVLWACFHAFGGSPPTAVVVMSYFVGMLGNVLPLPGGIGGVDGAMIGAFSAFGIAPALAVVAVLAYRALAFWLPTLPGAVAYLQLRRTVNRWRSETSPSYT